MYPCIHYQQYKRGSRHNSSSIVRVYFSDTFQIVSPWRLPPFGFSVTFLTSHDRFFLKGGNRTIWFKKRKKKLLVGCNNLYRKSSWKRKNLVRPIHTACVCYRERYTAPLNAINQIQWQHQEDRDFLFSPFFTQQITCWIIHWHRPNRLFWQCVLYPRERERISWCT